MAYLELNDLTMSFGETQVLKGIDLAIDEGEFVVFVGASGSGKSTLLRCISGLETPTSGDITLNGESILNRDPKDRDVAMVFQNYALYPHMNVYDNMAFGLKMRKVPKAEITQKVTDVAKLLGLDALLTRKPGQLSGGQCQRVALGRAIVRNPKLFMMDEPLSNLDTQLRQHMRQELKQLHLQLGATTLYVTHDQTETLTLADKVVVLDQGRISQCADPTTLYHEPANTFVAAFIAQMNFLTLIKNPDNMAQLQDSKGVVLIDSLRTPKEISVLLEGSDRITLGVRPEHVEVRSTIVGNPTTGLLADVEMPMILTQRELHGAQQTLRLASEEGKPFTLVASQPFESKSAIAVNERVSVGFNWTDIQCFDPETTKRL